MSKSEVCVSEGFFLAILTNAKTFIIAELKEDTSQHNSQHLFFTDIKKNDFQIKKSS